LSGNNRCAFIGSLIIITCMMLTVSLAEAEIGTGQLYVYIDTWGGIEANKGGPNGDTYFVARDTTYYIRVFGITEFNKGDLLTVKICWKMVFGSPSMGHVINQTTFFYDVPVMEDLDGVKYVDVAWTVPSSAKISSTSIAYYAEFLVAGRISNIGYMHIIPELLLGTVCAILALFGAFGIFKLRKADKT